MLFIYSILKNCNHFLRYIGKKINRKDIESSEDEIETEYDNDKISENEDDVDVDNDDEDNFNFEKNKFEYSSSECMEDQGKVENSKPSNDDEQNIFINSDVEKQISKAKSVKNQLIIFNNLLETRMKLQKLLSTINRLPQGEDYKNIKNSKSTLLSELLDDCTKGIKKIGKLLLEVDYFIKNDSKNEFNSNEKRKIFDFNDSNLSKKSCNLFNDNRSIIDSWHERTKFVNANIKLKKFDSFELCPTKLIEQVLTDKERLIKRTRIRRSDFKIIGQADDNNDYEYNEEIFNDDDFYHQLLKQIMENKIDDVDVDLRKYNEIQRMRNKLNKKQVDTRASKGRKIRYDVHEKLVNFMAPIDYSTYNNQALDELFKSLFGNFKTLNQQSD